MIYSAFRTILIGIIGVIVYILGYQYGVKHRVKEIRKTSIFYIICLCLLILLNLIFKGRIDSVKAFVLVIILVMFVTVIGLIYHLLIAIKETRIEKKVKTDYYKKKVNREKTRAKQKEEIIAILKDDVKHTKYNSIIIAGVIYIFVYLLVFALIF